MTRAWIGLGGNIGDVRRNMIAALRHMSRADGIAVRRVSGLYRTPPWGVVDQPDFLNSCAELETDLQPRELLDACLAAEEALHRERTLRWGPRTIDIDILVMEGVDIACDGLAVPHPRLKERAFALLPLADLVPEMSVGGARISEWLSGMDVSDIASVARGGEWNGGEGVWQA